MATDKGEIQSGRFLVPYRIYGEAGIMIFCVNGIQQTMAAWRSVISRFSKSFRIVVFDLPGQGRAQILSGPPQVAFEEQIQVIRDIVQLAEQHQFHLVGASWGATLAAVAATHIDHKIQKLILGSFWLRPTPQMIELIRKGQKLFHDGKKHDIAELMITSFGRHMPDYAKRKMIEQFKTMHHDQYLAFYEHCEQLVRTKHIDELADLRKIKAQTLLINGELDVLLLHEEIFREVVHLIPHCELKIVKGAGHFLHWEKEEILEIYAAYLEDREKGKSHEDKT